MLTRQRKQHILSVLARDGQVVAKPLSEALGLSEDTIRRDLRELAAEGRLQRVHGGALPLAPAEADLAGRQRIAPGEKVAIGRAAARMVRPGQVVFVDGGTTAVQLARHLPLDLRATVVTHSPAVAVALAQHPHLEIIVLGGRLFRHSMVHVGASVIEAAARFTADIYFMGAAGVHARHGLTTGDAEESDVKRALHRRAADTVVLASHEKLGAVSPFVIAPLGEIATLVVPPDVPARMQDELRQAGVKLQVAAR